MLRILIFPILLSLAVFFQSCDGYKKTEHGAKYKLIVDSAGTNAKIGDLVVMHVKYNNGKDSLNTYEKGHPISFPVMKIFDGGIEEALVFASKGDSMSIMVLNDSIYTKWWVRDRSAKVDTLPKGIKPGSFTTFNIKVLDVYTKEMMQKEEAEMKKERTQKTIGMVKMMKKEIIDSSQAQLKKDDVAIQNYVKKNKLTAQKTVNGIYYVITKEGTGIVPTSGDTVSLQYTGKLLDGTEFDKSKPERPLVFQLDLGQLIPGFDEAVSVLKEGTKATIIIPSSLAYGGYGRKKSPTEYLIPPNAPLVFDIELVKVKKWK